MQLVFALDAQVLLRLEHVFARLHGIVHCFSRSHHVSEFLFRLAAVGDPVQGAFGHFYPFVGLNVKFHRLFVLLEIIGDQVFQVGEGGVYFHRRLGERHQNIFVAHEPVAAET